MRADGAGRLPIAGPLWQYRHFIAGMAMRELKSRYARSALGSLWLLLSPFAMILVYTLVFSSVMHARLPGSPAPYAYSVFLCAGLLPWQWFSELVARLTGVFVDHAGLIRKSTFPHAALPAIILSASSMSFLLIFAMFLAFLAVAGPWPGWALLWCLPLLALQALLALGLGMMLGVMNVFFRDVGTLTGICLQFWFWLTPVVYPLSALPAWAAPIMRLNPFVPVVEGYHAIFLQQTMPPLASLAYPALLAAVALALAFRLYRAARLQLTDEL